MKFTFSRLNYREPAVLRGILGAVISLAGSIGITSNTDLNAVADAAILGGFTAWPVIQGLLTRAVVWSRRGKDEAVAAAVEKVVEGDAGLNPGDPPHRVIPQTPGLADHAAPNDQ